MPPHTRALVATLLMLAAAPAGAQVLAGRVLLTPAGAPAGHTAVALVGEGASVVAAGRTDAAGVFALEVGKPGTYRLLFFRAHSQPVGTAAFAMDSTPYVEHEFRIPGDTAAGEPIWLAGLVDTAAAMRAASHPPRYPDAQARAAVRGRVRVLFVVDAAGRVDERSVEVVGTTHEAFVEPVRRALKDARFTPAVTGGRRVRQLVQLTYDFGCFGDPPGGDVIVVSVYPACTAR